jgi:hypothetical protein
MLFQIIMYSLVIFAGGVAIIIIERIRGNSW